LRRKIEPDPARPLMIVTERGAGYQLVSDVETLY
jgi:DNA-binding response OmpR family regulator